VDRLEERRLVVIPKDKQVAFGMSTAPKETTQQMASVSPSYQNIFYWETLGTSGMEPRLYWRSSGRSATAFAWAALP
jgi:hypothetical protein